MISLFWDHKSKTWAQKQFNLIKVPMKYRCPTCGKILVKPKDRDFVDRYPQWGGFDLIGGVCKQCWLDGKGKYGNSLLARMLRKNGYTNN